MDKNRSFSFVIVDVGLFVNTLGNIFRISLLFVEKLMLVFMEEKKT